MNKMNSNMKHFRILVPLLLIALSACGGMEEGSPAEEPQQQVEDVAVSPAELSGSEAPEEVKAGDSYNTLAYNGACGAGYAVIDSHSLTGGAVYLTYSASTGKNCVVTVRSNPGSRVSMCAKVSRASAPWVQDCGSYTAYAGPVYVSARGACIDWGGSIGNSPYYESNVHCG
jgi:hypothetical protein